jgi:hypothetical protein
VGAPGVSAAAAAAGVGGEDEPLVLALAELLAVRRCAEPSLPEGGGIWVSTTGVPTVSTGMLKLLLDLHSTHSCTSDLARLITW